MALTLALPLSLLSALIYIFFMFLSFLFIFFLESLLPRPSHSKADEALQDHILSLQFISPKDLDLILPRREADALRKTSLPSRSLSLPDSETGKTESESENENDRAGRGLEEELYSESIQAGGSFPFSSFDIAIRELLRMNSYKVRKEYDMHLPRLTQCCMAYDRRLLINSPVLSTVRGSSVVLWRRGRDIALLLRWMK